ncbi:MAG: CbtB-domain containing protein [Bauldia sp.]|nr:MAG: CbtB-domain containing protein [Bauldia sp.]MBZ0230358.1 CbtB-domain containing protein [Bauldia sp.]
MLASQPTLSRISTRAIPAVVAILFGLALFFTTGFAWPGALHNATHDTRHALGLPCH